MRYKLPCVRSAPLGRKRRTRKEGVNHGQERVLPSRRVFVEKQAKSARSARFAPSFGGFSRGTGEKSLKTRKSEFLTYALKSVSLLRKGQKGIKTAQRAI